MCVVQSCIICVIVPVSRHVSAKSCRAAARMTRAQSNLHLCKKRALRRPFLFFGKNALTKLRFDPQLIPVESLAGEAPVATERLAEQWLRQRFADQAEWTPEPSDE